jgi:hypothetical protein
MPALFSRSLTLLSSNWLLLVPGLIAGLIIAVIKSLFVFWFFVPEMSMHAGMFSAVAGLLSSWFAYGTLNGVLTLIAIAVMTSMAGRVWDDGRATFDDAVRVFRENDNQLFLSLLQIIGITLVAAFLALPTGGVSICAAFFFLTYAVASAVIGQRPGFAAIRDSFDIAMRRLGPTLILFAAYCGLLMIAGMLSFVFGRIFFIGPLISGILQQAVTAYMTLVIVGEYIRVQRGF